MGATMHPMVAALKTFPMYLLEIKSKNSDNSTLPEDTSLLELRAKPVIARPN
jgi:hypothetical protein